MITWTLALVLTVGMAAMVYLPYRAAKPLGVPTPSRGEGNMGSVEADVEHVLRLWYCLTCGGRLERLDQTICTHCGSAVEDGGES